MTKKFTLNVIRAVEVTVDETKFTEEFMEEYRESFSPFFYLKDHIEHLGWLFAARGVDDTDFIEGYGPAEDFGIKFREIDDEVEFVD